jgi:hypothetical protein
VEALGPGDSVHEAAPVLIDLEQEDFAEVLLARAFFRAGPYHEVLA